MVTLDQLERLTLLTEELGEAIQAAQKIIRHGYKNYNPCSMPIIFNREHLEKELGHIANALDLMEIAGDIDLKKIGTHQQQKARGVSRWLHRKENIRLMERINER